MAVAEIQGFLRCSSLEHSPLKGHSTTMKRSSSDGDLFKPRSLSGSEASLELLDEMFQLEELEDQFVDEASISSAPLDLHELLDSLNTRKAFLGKRRIIESCPTNEGHWVEREIDVKCTVRHQYNRIIGKDIMKAIKRRRI
eukprot:757934-Hanusia_phi.AAC.7